MTTTPEMSCPKCGAKQTPAPACRKCGLAADRMSAFRRRHTTFALELTTAWKECEAAWGDAAVHEKFIALVVAKEAYAFAAKRYRDTLVSRPGDPTATAYVDKLGKMVAAQLMVSGTAKDAKAPKPYKNTIAILVVLVIVIVAGLLYAMLRGS